MSEFGEFLYELRKEKGMTQAALAERLGVTNKAVSKWETGEAMPETSLLKPIAEIFGVTADELLAGRRLDAERHELTPSEGFEKDKHLFTSGKDDPPETLLDKISGAVCAAVTLIGVAVYIFLGVFADLWHPYWVIIPVCALGSGIIGIVFNLADGEKRKRKLENGKNPYSESICGILMLACIIAYLLCGALANLWHPYWLIIVVGGVLDGIIGAVGNCFTSKK